MSSNAYDPEAGKFAVPGGRRTLRLMLARKSRLVIGVAALFTIIFYLSQNGPSTSVPPPPVVVPHGGDGRLPVDDIWDDVPPPVEGVQGKAPAPPSRPPRPDHPRYYIIDDNGDHFLPNAGRKVAPMHPGQKDIVDPADLFPEVELPWHFKAPMDDPFPRERMREIVSEAPDPPNAIAKVTLDKKDFSQTWKGPADWNKAGPGVKNVQWPSFKLKDREWESTEQAERREERRKAVKRGFVHAWQAYKDHAWGHDEVMPKSKKPSDPFNGWGASIVDTLDTLLVMGLQEEYNLCRRHVNQLNFHWVTGRDWSQGYIGLDGELDAHGKQWAIDRDRTAGLPVFETGIRYLGGLLGAYDLTGDKLMLDRAVDIAEILGRAFNTKSGLPQGSRIDPGQETGVYQLGSVSAAEVGSMTLELMRLSFATGDRKWFDLAQRAMDFIDKKVVPRSKFKPLIPMHFSPDAPSQATVTGGFTFGAMCDSYYEYLIKTYKLLGGNEVAKQYKRLYEDSIDAARKLLFVDINIVPDTKLMTIGKWEHGGLHNETEHLACFAGAMLGLGAKLLDRPQDMSDAAKFTGTCYWLSAATKTGIQPEVVHFYSDDDESRFQNMTTELGPNGEPRMWHPPITQPFREDQINYAKMHKSTKGEWLYNDDHSPVANNSGRVGNNPISYYRHLVGEPAGTKRVGTYYINRPETIESVFYMWRLTGDRGWQDKGWRMFTSWMEHGKVDGGISSIQDVTADPTTGRGVLHGDNMESFIFAETFKYHYLLQADPLLLDLDDYVLNTEAHPFIVDPKTTKPGSQGLWKPVDDADAELGVRGEGTDAQKWMRLKALEGKRPVKAKPLNPRLNAGGGHGMGGGAGAGKLGVSPDVIIV